MSFLVITMAMACVVSQTEQLDDQRKQEVELWRKYLGDVVKEYRLVSADQPAKPLQRIERPLFLWNQPIRRGQIGSLYLWLRRDGRPAAIGTLFCWYQTQQGWLVMHEFHSLAQKPLKLAFRGRTVWAPTEPGLRWKTLEEGTKVATSRRRQLSQIRQLARRFQAHTLALDKARWELRLLSRPLHEYATGQGDALKCGAVFAMCQGMDPEVILVIEARSTSNGTRWHYACGAFTDYELHVRYRGQEVWSAPPTPDGTIFSPDKAYWRDFIARNVPVPTPDSTSVDR